MEGARQRLAPFPFFAGKLPVVSEPSIPIAEPLLVACLCAQWCRTCDAYRDSLVAVKAAIALGHPDAATRFVWVDIEDESDLVGDLDIEDFPTILLARADQVLFFGPVMPHVQTLDRLVRSALDTDLPALARDALAPDVRALPARLRTHAAL
jgi:thioredoxin 1